MQNENGVSDIRMGVNQSVRESPLCKNNMFNVECDFNFEFSYYKKHNTKANI